MPTEHPDDAHGINPTARFRYHVVDGRHVVDVIDPTSTPPNAVVGSGVSGTSEAVARHLARRLARTNGLE